MAPYPEALPGGIAALVYAASMLAIGLWMAFALPRSRVTNALLFFAGCTIGMWGIYGTLYTLAATVDTDPIRWLTSGLAGVFRITVWLILAAWIHLAMAITPGPRTGPPLRVMVPVGMVLGLLNYANVNHSPWQFRTSLVIQSIPVILVAIGILVYVVRVRHGTKQGTVARRRANAYLIAFLAHDIVVLVFFSLLGVLFASSASNAATVGVESIIAAISFSLLVLVFIPSLVYSVATGRILDFERRAHFTVSRATLVAFFVGIFVAAQTFVSEFFTTTAGLAAGAVAAGILVFALTPLQRLAEGLADRAVPQGRATDKLDWEEKQAFYRDQVEIAYSDGSLGPKDRKSLKSVRERLQLDPAVVLQIEERVAAGAGAA